MQNNCIGTLAATSHILKFDNVEVKPQMNCLLCWLIYNFDVLSLYFCALFSSSGLEL